MINISTRNFPAPFSAPRGRLKGRTGGVMITAESSLEERRLYLQGQTSNYFSGVELLGELYTKLFSVAFKNFLPFGKSLIWAVYCEEERGGFAVTVPRDKLSSPVLGEESTSFFCGSVPESPYQPELVEAAVEAKEPKLFESEQGAFLAMPLLGPNRKDLVGVLLFSNLVSQGENDFTENDVTIATILAEHLARGIKRLKPDTPAATLGELSSRRLVEELARRAFRWWVARR